MIKPPPFAARFVDTCDIRPPSHRYAAWRRIGFIRPLRLEGLPPAMQQTRFAIVRLLGGQREAEILAHNPGEKPTHRMLLPACRLHDGGYGGATRPHQQCNNLCLFRIGTCRATLGCLCTLAVLWALL